MKIAVNTRFLLPGKLEGIGWYTHEIVRRLVAQHPKDEFVFLFDRPFDARFVYGPNVRPIVVPPPARHPLLWYLWFEWALPPVLRRLQPDVFFSPDAYLSLRANTRTVLTVHDIIPLQHPEQVPFVSRQYYRYFLPRYLRRANQIATVSHFVKQSIVERCGISAEKIAVVYNGCRDNFKPLSETEKQNVRAQFTDNQPFFFYTGAIHPRKNIPRLIRAFDRFKTETGAPVKLLLAGRFAWHTGEVTQALESARHRNDVRMLGYVPEQDLPRLMASALALAYVSLSEGFGLPVLEAMYCDTPVIASNTTALPEIAGEGALLVDPGSEREISMALKKIYSAEISLSNLIHHSQIQRQQFDWNTAADQTYQLLHG